MSLFCKTILTLRKKQAGANKRAPVDKTGSAHKFCTFFVDKIVRKAMHGSSSP